jgi:hypothetical protein
MSKIAAPLMFSLAVLGAGPVTAADPVPVQPAPPAIPAPAPEVSLVDLIGALSKFLTEEETQLVYDYLWDTSIAALKGNSTEDIVLPPELAFKLAILQRRIVKEGGHYLEGLANRMEKDLANWQKNLQTVPPPVPYSLPSDRNKAAPAQP